MMVVESINGYPRVVSKVKRKVRLAAGLDADNVLSLEAMQRGWSCLALFGEHLSSLNLNHVRVVSTATLRLAKNANEFCDKGNQLLGADINIISGEQEAALIYHGMAVTSNSADKRLIIDIGGASTELILGCGLSPIVLNSLNMGCVTWLERYFVDGILSQANFDAAIEASKKVLTPVKDDYLAHQWQLTLGASGSVQAVQEVLIAQGYNEEVTLDKLIILMAQCIACKSQDALVLTGLKAERAAVFVSGLSILIMLFQELSINGMLASGGALREGVINQLIGQQVSDDICLHTCQSIQQRFQLNVEQASQVGQLAQRFALQLNIPESLHRYLDYSAMVHEIGLSVNYLDAQHHGQYLLTHMALAGFSAQQKNLVVALVGNYQGVINQTLITEQGCCDQSHAAQLLLCLRLAIICVGQAQLKRCLAISIHHGDNGIMVDVTSELSAAAPLMMIDIEHEVAMNDLTTLSSHHLGNDS